MPRILPLEYEETTGDARAAFDEGLVKWGRLTNLKRTLLHSPLSYNIAMEWYQLLHNIKGFIGERLAIIFAHAISSESGCLICTTFMRRILIDGGDDPGELNLDERGETLVAFAHAVARQGNRVSNELYSKMASFFSPEQIVALTTFAGMMIVSNLVNNALEIDLDEYLYEYREGQPLPKKIAKSSA
ncbi:carboxymuconolactone decarboxylase family protein [Chloroflexota bacterium]